MRLSILFLFITLLFSACESVTHKKSAPVPRDTTPPQLTLKGDKNITLPLHQSFQDPGATAVDDFDGDISSKIEHNSTLNTNKVGLYSVEYSVTDSAGNRAVAKRYIRVTTFANARLGVLADANVTLYRLENDGNHTLMWQERSSRDTTLQKSGKFDTHAEALEDGKLYLIEVNGGINLDSNNNGLKDSNETVNSGKLRAIVTKNEIIELAQKLNITALSELIYEELLPLLKHNYNRDAILAAREQFTKELTSDINGDGNIDFKDILSFNPVNDQKKLLGALHNNYNSVADTIRDGKLAILNMSQRVANIPTFNFARNITFNQDRSKIFVADGTSGITIIYNESKKTLANIKTKDFARHIALSSDEKLAFVADSKAGLTIVDLAEKKIIANFPTYDANATGDHDARYILLSQDYSKLYLAASESGVLIFNISNPGEPQLIGQYDTPDIAYNIKLSSDEKRLFIADGKTGLIAVKSDDNTTLDTFNTYGSANSVTLSHDETKAYIADGYKGVVIVDISNPSDISYIGHIDTPDFASAITLNNNESKAYVADRKSNIQVIDLQSEKYKIIQSIQTPFRTYATALAPDESYLYAATGTNGLEIVATNSFKNPFIVNHIKTDYKSYHVTLENNYLYVTEGKAGLQIVNIEKKENPKVMTTFDTNGFTLDIAIDNTIAYLADGYKGVKKLDINSKLNPEIIDSVDTDGFTSSLQYLSKSNELLISDGTKGIKLFDTQNLTLLDSFTPDSKALDVTLSTDEKKAYIALGKGGVLMLSIDNSQLTNKHIIATNSYIKQITLDGAKAYLSGDKSQLLVMDLTNNTIIKSVPIGEFAYSSSADSKYIYVANGKDGITIIDKESYKVLGSIDCQGEVRNIVIKDGLLYGASSEGGICIIDASPL